MTSDEPQPKKIGRPRKYESDGKRPTLTFRARGSLYEKLKQGALEGERSLSEEIEQRLEYSYVLEDNYVELRKYISFLTGGSKDAEDLLRKISNVISALQSSKLPDGRSLGSTNWSDSPLIRVAVNSAIRAVADELVPLDGRQNFPNSDEIFAESDLPRDVQIALVIGRIAGLGAAGRVTVTDLEALAKKMSKQNESK